MSGFVYPFQLASSTNLQKDGLWEPDQGKAATSLAVFGSKRQQNLVVPIIATTLGSGTEHHNSSKARSQHHMFS
jgi:hypothetical protein